jgi:hypothetical protein
MKSLLKVLLVWLAKFSTRGGQFGESDSLASWIASLLDSYFVVK